MPTRGSAPEILVDTSVAVALVDADHEHHLAMVEALRDRRLSLGTPRGFRDVFSSDRASAAGSVYYALVGAAAIENGLKLATRDQRALATYRALQVDVEVLVEQ